MVSNGKVIIASGGRIICVGDLHGCYEEAIELLDACKLTPKDVVVFLGDLVDRGPENAKCVDLAMRHECILGNHEEKHLQYRRVEEQGHVPHVVASTHVETRNQLRPEHYEYFKTLPLFIRFPEHNAVAVHAGVYPGRPIEAQDPNHLLHIQMINPPDKASKWPSKAPEGWKFWSNFWDGPEKVIFGHSVITKPLITDKVVGIDGGAVFGYELWAYEMPSGKVYSVRGKQNHGQGRRGRPTDGNNISTYLIHGDVGTYS